MVISTILLYAFGAGSYCFHCMWVYSLLFSMDPPVKMKYRLSWSIQNKSPNTGFVLCTLLVNNPLISPWFCNYMLDRYSIWNYRVAVLIMPMKRIPCFHNSSAAGTEAKYDSVQTIIFMLANGSTNYLSTLVPWRRFPSSYSWSDSFLAYLTILICIIIPERPHAAFWISAPFSVFIYIATYIGKPKFIQ